MSDSIQTENRLASAKVVAKKLGVSERQLYRLADMGRVPWGIKLGRLRRWNLAEIEEFIAAGCKSLTK